MPILGHDECATSYDQSLTYKKRFDPHILPNLHWIDSGETFHFSEEHLNQLHSTWTASAKSMVVIQPARQRNWLIFGKNVVSIIIKIIQIR